MSFQDREDRIRREEYEAKCLGGRRNLEDYTIEKLTLTPKIATAIEVLKTLNIKTDNVFIYGPVGSGKTHLAVAVARNHIAKGVTVIKPMEIFRAMRSKEANQEQNAINDYVERKVLVIDDVGVSKDSEYAAVMLYEIIEGRYSEKMGGLIVTSNLSLGALAEKIGDDRICSRLAQMCRVIDLSGESDHRLLK